jgi:hypothetical protein
LTTEKVGEVEVDPDQFSRGAVKTLGDLVGFLRRFGAAVTMHFE